MFSDQDKKKAISLYRSGMTLEEVSDEIGTSKQSVSNWLDDAGTGTRGCLGAAVIRQRKGRGKSIGEEKWKEVTDTYASGIGCDEVAKIFGITSRGVRKIIKRQGGVFRGVTEGTRLAISKAVRRFAVDEVFFNRDLDECGAWLLGVIYGDGCVWRYKGTLNGLEISGDKDVCEKAKKILGSEHRVFRKKKTNCYVLRIGSRALAESLAQWGVVPRKSNILEWPKLSKNMESHFVRGLIDSDGWVKRTGEFGIGLGMTARQIVEEVATRMRHFSVSGRVSITKGKKKKKRHAISYQTRVYTVTALSFGRWIWFGSDDSMRGRRKYGIYAKEAARCGVLEKAS